MANYRATLDRLIATPEGYEWLPPVWHLIYEEGIQGNHILFQDADLASIRQAISKGHLDWTDEYGREVEDRAVHLLRLNSIESIRRHVDLLSTDEKLGLFLVYQCGLGLWGSALKRGLN